MGIVKCFNKNMRLELVSYADSLKLYMDITHGATKHMSNIQHHRKGLDDVIKILKNKMFKTINSAKTGHIGECCSSTELMAVLYFTDILRYDIEDPKHPNRDYVLVRGHLGPLRYNIFSMLGWLKSEEMSDYRKYGSRLCGHEDMNITPGVDLTPSGSLGMLLSYAVGANIGFKKTGRSNRIFCFLGDREEQEGNVSEAARHASNINCKNLIVIIDANTKQLSTATQFTDGGADLSYIWEGYGWNVLTIENGHDPVEIYTTLKTAVKASSEGPVCVIAHTIKGNGLDGAIGHYCGYHVYHNNEVNVTPTTTARTISNLLTDEPINSDIKLSIKRRNLGSYEEHVIPQLQPIKLNCNLNSDACSYDYLTGFLNELAKVQNRVYVLTDDYPLLMNDKGQPNIEGLIYINVGVREQHLCAMAHGLRVVDPSSIIIILCGDAFMYRCADQVNVLAQSDDNIIIYNVQAGLSGAQNGVTHQSSGQPGIFVTMPGVKVYEPFSQLDWEYSMNRALLEHGVKYIRTHKGYSIQGKQTGDYYEIPLIEEDSSPSMMKDITELIGIMKNITELIGIMKGLFRCMYERFIIITSGMTTFNVVEAAKSLQNRGINGKVINIVSFKDLNGIGKLIPSNVPIFFFYNGNVEILSSIICRQLCIENIIPGKIYERGFTLGVTGSITDVMKHFHFDPKSISTFIETNI